MALPYRESDEAGQGDWRDETENCGGHGCQSGHVILDPTPSCATVPHQVPQL